jgi:hypothetical protein
MKKYKELDRTSIALAESERTGERRINPNPSKDEWNPVDTVASKAQ